jgi:drug/metabolite transporter (DMT)-like permease
MPATVTLAVLLAAVLHAVWNLLAKQFADRLAGFALLGLTMSLGAAATIGLLPRPAAASWRYLAVSAVLHVAYALLLLQSYRVGDLSQVYPLARGLSPLLVAGAAGLVAGERLSGGQLAGVAVVCVGLASLALVADRPAAQDRFAVAFAAATGVMIAAYTVTDGLGVRRAGNALAYAAWLFLFQGAGLALSVLALRRRPLRPALPAVALPAAVAGVLALVGYALVLWAQTRGALAVVAALRETSVIVAAALGAVLLRERFGRVRVVAAVLVAVGIALIDLR